METFEVRLFIHFNPFADVRSRNRGERYAVIFIRHEPEAGRATNSLTKLSNDQSVAEQIMYKPLPGTKIKQQ